MLGYLEQGVATALIDSLGAVGTAKPKFPFLSSTQSALYYVGMHLKGKISMIIFCLSTLVLRHSAGSDYG